MKIRQRIPIVLAVSVVFLFLFAFAGTALGASASGRLSTVLEWFDDSQEDTAIPVYQYLLVNLNDLDGKGLNFRGYGRLADDLENEVEAKSRLYYAYLEKKDFWEDLDVKLGRQFISTSAGASLMDGLTLKMRNLGPVKATLFGGGDVAYYEGYNADNLVAGAELAGRFWGSLDVGISYMTKWDESEITHELIGLDADYTFDQKVNLYSEVQYSWVTDEVTYFIGGAKYYENPKWSLRGEYLYSLPVFSSTSIYSVFAASEYEEVMLEYVYNIDIGLKAFVRYTLEIYEDFDDENVYEAGVEKIRTDSFSGYLTGVWREGGDGGQDLRGIKARLAYMPGAKWQAGVGLHLDVAERWVEDDDETTNTRIWADVTVYLSKKLNVQAKVERVESDLYDYYNRGRLRLNILF